MNTSSSNQFSLMIAYLLPGFIALAGIAPLVPAISGWLQPGLCAEAGFGPPVYAVLAAVTIGMVLSCFRWILIDSLHRATGLRIKPWDARQLDDRLSAFNYLVENHYRFYQFYGNVLIAVAFSYALNRWLGTSNFFGIATDLGAVVLCAVLFAGSRDALRKYHARVGRLVGELTEKGN